MRLIKTFCLAAITVSALTASLVSALASATSLEEVVLCKALENPCFNGHFSSGTKLDLLAVVPRFLFLGFSFSLFCQAAHLSGETTSSLAHGKVSAHSWLGCETEEGEPCTVVSKNLPWLIKFELQANHVGYEALVTGGGAGSPSVEIECAGVPACRYGVNTLLHEALHVSGVTTLDLLQSIFGEGGFCAFSEGVAHAKYTLKCLSGSSEVNCYPAMHPNVPL
jgi:hypothetical protein